MRSNLERELDLEFEELGLKPRIFHFKQDVAFPYRAITVATMKDISLLDLRTLIRRTITDTYAPLVTKTPTTVIKNKLVSEGYGVAICDWRDKFNRRLGRTIAKGRLLKYINQSPSLSEGSSRLIDKNIG